MPTRREAMALLYADRVRAGVCVCCEQPARPYVYCHDCRTDRRQRMQARRRYLTVLRVTVEHAHTST